jgi:hypothetical protein
MMYRGKNQLYRLINREYGNSQAFTPILRRKPEPVFRLFAAWRKSLNLKAESILL